MCVVGLPEGKELGEWNRKICEEILNRNFPNLTKDIKLSIQYLSKSKHDQYKGNYIEAHHIQTAEAKDKDKILKGEGGAHLKTIKMTAEEKKRGEKPHYQS